MTHMRNASMPKHSIGCFEAIFALARKRLTLIFRKVADVRREKELAERRKNEPQLDQAQDHLVRKIFSRFRREKQHTADVEKGESKDTKDSETSHLKKLSTAEEAGTAIAKARPGKWGRLLGSSSLDSGSESGTVSDTFKRSLSARDPRPSSSAGTNKVFPKIGKLGGTIEEAADNADNTKDTQQQQTQQAQQQQTLSVDSKQLQLRRLESYDSGLITQQPSHEREILAAVLEVKVDLKLEVQRVNQRLAKIEDMLQALVNRLPATATPPSVGGGGVQQPKVPNFVTNQSPTTTSVTLVQCATQTTPSIATTSTSTTPSEGYREQSTATERMPKSQEHHHHHHHHHQSSSERHKDTDRLAASRDVNKELLERLAQASTSRGDDSNALGPLILRKRRSKSRNKGAAPLAPLATQPVSPSEPTETTQMLESTDDRDSTGGSAERTATERATERSERKRPPPRPREYL